MIVASSRDARRVSWSRTLTVCKGSVATLADPMATVSVQGLMTEARLLVVRDGVDLPEEQARALWRAFSEHMERSQHDYDGFARDHGFVSVRAEHRRGRAVLIVSSSASMPPPRPSRRGDSIPSPRKARESVAPQARTSSAGKRR